MLNKKDLERYQKKLIERKKVISDQLSEFYNESKTLESGEAQDVGDKAESSYTKEFLLSLSDAEREQLSQIDAALKRIHKDKFGICERCEKKIPAKRLDALPWTPHCIECQQEEEEETL